MTIRVAHVIAGLPVGGAERMLLALCDHGRKVGLESTVICLAPPGPVSEQLRDAGIPLEHLGLTSVWRFPLGLGPLKRRLQSVDPDVIQGWMYHGNIAALAAGRGTNAPVAWNIRQSLHRTDLFKGTTRLMIRANAAVSQRVDSIVYNSEVARNQHEKIGFTEATGTLIPNGVDPQRFTTDLEQNPGLRQSLGIEHDAIVIIAVGRANAIKGHDVLLQAARKVSQAKVPIHFLVVGEGTCWSAEPYAEFASDASIRQSVTLAGGRNDVPDLLSIADVFVSASKTEGFPNAVAEAMAAGLPCVVTDVGDSAMLLADAGLVVSPGDADGLAMGIVDLAQRTEADRKALGAGGRQRIQSEFSIDAMVQRYADHYRSLVN
jgi:glycosyltransferase involved in cell wall biosynthesis